MSETTTEQETRYPNREEQIRSLLDRVIDRAREDIEYICRDLEQSRSNRYALQYADVRSRMLEADVEHIRKAIFDLRGEIDV